MGRVWRREEEESMKSIRIVLGAALCASLATQADTICLEAEQFADRGGWAVDS